MKSETLTISLEKSTQDSIPFYSPSQPFGFVDEAAHNAQPSLNIFELNSGFNVPYWYASEPITQIQQDENGWVPVPCVERLCAAGRSFVHLFFCQCFAHHSQWKNSGF